MISIVGPLSTVYNWQAELYKWFAGYNINVEIIGGSKEDRQQQWKNIHKLEQNRNISFPILVTNYEIILNDYSQFDKIKYKFIIIDEGQKLKNINSILLKKLKLLNSENRLIITGL